MKNIIYEKNIKKHHSIDIQQIKNIKSKNKRDIKNKIEIIVKQIYYIYKENLKKWGKVILQFIVKFYNPLLYKHMTNKQTKKN